MPELVIALDVASKDEALKIINALSGLPVWFKVGLELFTATGTDLIKYLKDKQFNVFLDLKMFDIPNTVANAVKAANNLGVDMLTIHLLGGERMVHAATKALDDKASMKKPIILGVTVLTSTAQDDISYAHNGIKALVLDLALNAHHWGVNGVVASGHEVKDIKRNCGLDFLCLTPGIRPKNYKESDDQRRTMTPAQAALEGSDFLVVGRPIVQSKCPLTITNSILDEINTL